METIKRTTKSSMESNKSMKTVYFGHSRSFDFEKEWYEPIRALNFAIGINAIFPHDAQGEGIDTKELFESGCALFVAEVSFPSTGLGIELGYAKMLQVPTVCFFKKGASVSGSIKRITDDCIEYSDTDDLQKKLQKVVSAL